MAFCKGAISCLPCLVKGLKGISLQSQIKEKFCVYVLVDV